MNIWRAFWPKKQKAILTSAELAELIDSAGSTSNSGQSVSTTTAMQCAAVYACVKVLAESVGQLPLKLYQRAGNSKEEATKHNLYNKLKYIPNSWMTRQDFLEYLVVCLCLKGNSFNYINRVTGGTITELVPLNPDCVTVEQNTNFSLKYTYASKTKTEEIRPENMWHVKGLSLDGFSGVSPIAYHKEAIGLSLATERHGANLFSRGGRPSGVLEHPGKLGAEAAARISAGWKRAHGGTNQGGTALLEEGMKYATVSMNNEDMQFLETRKYQRSEIASIFRVPPHLIGDLEKSTYSNIEQQSLEFIKYSLMPWLTRIELSIYRDLLSPGEKEKYFAEFLVDGMERGDIETRYNAYVQGLQNGILSPNEVRAKENLNPRPGGEVYLTPMNMTTDPNKTDKALITKSSSLDARIRLRTVYKEAFKNVFRKIVDKDVSAVKYVLSKEIKSQEGLEEWLATYYKDFPKYAQAEFISSLKAYADQVKEASLKDVGLTGQVEGLSDFIKDYAQTFGNAYAISSIAQLKSILQETEPEEIKTALETRLDEWAEKRADKLTEDEIVKAGNAISRMVWGAAGVKALKWRTMSSDPCEFCRTMNGKTVGILDNFLDKGTAITSPQGNQLKIRGSKKHPPIHSGCGCAIVPA